MVLPPSSIPRVSLINCYYGTDYTYTAEYSDAMRAAGRDVSNIWVCEKSERVAVTRTTSRYMPRLRSTEMTFVRTPEQAGNNCLHPSNQRIYINCSLLQDSPDSFDHLSLLYFSFPVLSDIGTRTFSAAAPTLWNSLPVSIISVGNIL